MTDFATWRFLYDYTAHASGDEMASHLRGVHHVPRLVVDHLRAVGRSAIAGFHMADHAEPIWVFHVDHRHRVEVPARG